MSIFSDNLYLMRKRAKLSQEQFSEQLGICRDTVSKWENDKGVPDINQLCKICDLLGCDPDKLLGRIDADKHDEQIVADLIGLSPESIKTLREWHVEELIIDPFSKEKLLHPETNSLNSVIEKFPEVISLISEVFDCPSNDERLLKFKCMRIALTLWLYKTKGAGAHYTYETRNVYKFASDFVYSRLSMLENWAAGKLQEHEEYEEYEEGVVMS